MRVFLLALAILDDIIGIIFIAVLFAPRVELVEPGLVFLPLWRPDGTTPTQGRPEAISGYAGVGRRD